MNGTDTLRVAFPGYESASHYDPLKIHFSYEYIFLENIFSPLIDYSPSGELVSGVAERFEWVGTEARFKIQPGLKTIDGKKIDAYDVEQSLKRMFIIGGNTHGNLKDLVCPGAKLRKYTDACPGMEVRDGGATFVLKFQKKNPFLFPMLTAIDFAVIPRDSIDPATLEIRDFRNTSGPYYASEDSANGEITLTANPNHFNYSAAIPQKVQLIPAGKPNETESLDLFAQGKVDHITSIDKAQPGAIIPFANARKDVFLHATHPLRLHVLVFTGNGLKRFTEAERISIGKTFKKLFLSLYATKPEYKPAEQLFPLFGEGSLSESETATVSAKLAAVPEADIFQKEILGWDVPGMFPENNAEIERRFPGLRLLRVRKFPGMVDYKKEGLEEPDFYLTRTDMGFQEDVGLLSYYFSQEFFYLRGESGKAWLEKYLEIPSKQDRLALLRELHYRTLLTATAFPMGVAPYAAIVRSPWTINFSKYHANNPIWRIRKD